jgi:acid phosphatase type 7
MRYALGGLITFLLLLPAVPAAAADPVLVAVGDIACDPDSPYFDEDGGERCEMEVTAELAKQLNPTRVAALGDLQYEDGTLGDFQRSYDPTWGDLYDTTRPAVGNHEYHTPNAQGYRDYWNNIGDRDLAYAYNLGSWRIYVLNSNCSELDKPGVVGSCAAQANWLRRDQLANPRRCVLAYWHHPLRSTSAESGTTTAVRPFWHALYEYRADVVLVGHGHVYEEWEKLSPTGGRSDRGIKQFTVGTGGKSLYPFKPFDDRIAGDHRANDEFGVLRLGLHASSYDFKFVTPTGSKWAGTRNCV